MIINCNDLKGASRRIEFQALLDLHQPDIVLGYESKLDKDILTYSVFPQYFTVFRNDGNCNGGGVFQAIKSDIVCEERPNFGNNSELIWSSVKFNNCETLHFASCYRPPNSSPEVLDQISDSFNRVVESCDNHPNIVAGGDFNLGDIDWSAEVSFATNSDTSAQHNKLLQLSEDLSFTQHVKSPTRPASGKTLDLLFSSYPNVISNVTLVPGMSDHLVFLFNIPGDL